MGKTILITGAAGFIGYHTSRAFLAEGWRVFGFDAMTDYYDPALKRRRLAMLSQNPGFAFTEARLETPGALESVIEQATPDVILHLAAQAGVRYSIEAPQTYVDSNLFGTYRVLELARAAKTPHVLFASTSSVYGANTDMPYRETDRTAHQMSFYAATKMAGEAMSHSYAHLYKIPVTAFRFFTVYGAWGRPDMAYFKFARAIMEGRPIEVYNHGNMQRDFTYVEDLAWAVVKLATVPPPQVEGRGAALAHDSLSPVAPWRVVNIGNAEPAPLGQFIETLETCLGRKADKLMMDMQPGDVPATWASADLLHALIGPMDRTPMQQGLQAFVDWYLAEYHG